MSYDDRIHNVYFKVSTADMFQTSEIVHLVAVPESKKFPIFERFIYPQGDISEDASKVHRLYKEDGKLFKRDKEITNDVDPYEAYDDFVDWIDDNFKRRTGDKVRFIGHDALERDAHVLVYNLKREDDRYKGRSCERICDRIDFFSDTIVSFRHFFRKVKNYQLETLMKYFKMTRRYDPLYAARDLRDLVDRALDSEIHPAFHEWSQMTSEEFIRELYPN